MSNQVRIEQIIREFHECEANVGPAKALHMLASALAREELRVDPLRLAYEHDPGCLEHAARLLRWWAATRADVREHITQSHEVAKALLALDGYGKNRGAAFTTTGPPPPGLTVGEVTELLEACVEVLDDYSDVNDGADGRPVANRAMSAITDVQRVLARLGRIEATKEIA